jgi:hypothetical protein
MKHASVVLLISCVCVSVLWAQSAPTVTAPAIHGHGTPNVIPKFTGTTSIGNTAIYVGHRGPVQIDGCLSESPSLDTTAAGIFCLHDLGGGATVHAMSDFPDRVTFISENDSFVGNPVAVEGFTTSADGGIAMFGFAANDVGPGIGTFGWTSGNAGKGVLGRASSESGNGVGVEGQSFSADGVAGTFNNFAGGTILAGISANVLRFRVDGLGNAFANSYNVGGADFAESVSVSGARSEYSPGDLLVIDPKSSRRLTLSQQPYSALVAGIYSTKPGVVASPHSMDDPSLTKEVPMAVVGIVPCRVSAENGPIEVGDLLVASSSPGHAMKGTDRNKMLGAVVGKALEQLREGKGVIEVLVTLQ